jgi:hypothetical protein
MACVSVPQFPSGSCSGPSTWQVIGGVWKPVDGASLLSGGCIYAVHFKNGSRDIIVRPADGSDPNFVALAAQFPTAFASAEVVDGLSADDTTALWSKYPNDVLFDVAAAKFLLPLVPREQTEEGVDITPGPDPTPLPPELQALIFGNSK